MATVLLPIAEHQFSATDSVFVSLEYDTTTLACDAVVIDNQFGHQIVATVTGPSNQTFTQTFSQSGVGLRVPVAGVTLVNRTSPKGVQYVGLPVGWSVRVDVT